MREITLLAVVALPLTFGCAARPMEPVPVSAAEQELQALAGTWVGEYSSVETGRSGIIRFNLPRVDDRPQASGEVVMIADSRRVPFTPAEPSGHTTVQTLTIRFVRVEGTTRTVSGTLEPYRDPDCGCIVSTTFVGRISGDRIEGTFVSQSGSTGVSQVGRWRADRTKS